MCSTIFVTYLHRTLQFFWILFSFFFPVLHKKWVQDAIFPFSIASAQTEVGLRLLFFYDVSVSIVQKKEGSGIIATSIIV